ncbi:PAS domain S-box protein [Reichenbachiella sp. MALMAid0571]|uniref:PAS domain S-box protein n=1 Tax=Reichenbachiella sp. MALMAid0571 TaxID=3143939 RepID=UPI0032E008DB
MSNSVQKQASSTQNYPTREPMFRILKNDWSVIDYSGSENILSGKKSKKFIGQPFYKLLGLKKSDNPLKQLEGNSAPFNTFLLENVSVRNQSYNIRIINTGEKECIAILKDVTEQKKTEFKLKQSQKEFIDVFNSITDVYYKTNSDRVIETISPSIERITGKKPEVFIGKKTTSLIEKQKADNIFKTLEALGRVEDLRVSVDLPNGDTKVLSFSIIAEYDDNKKIIGTNGIIRDITKLNKQNQLTQLNKEILEKAAKGNDLFEILNFTCKGIEILYPELICSVLLYDPINKWLTNGASPSLPETYIKLIHQYPIGPSSGSCGTAAFTQKTIIVSDIEHDPLWAGSAHPALNENLKACWSVPIISSEKQTLGTFAVYYNKVKEPNNDELELIQNIGTFLSVVIENYKNKEALVSNEKRYRQLVNNSPVAILIHTDGLIQFVNDEVIRIAKARNKEDLLGKNILDFVKPQFWEEVKKKMAITAKTKTRSEEQFIKLDGNIVDVEVIGTPIIYQGQPATQLVFHDISDRKTLEAKQNSLNEYLIKQNKQLEEFAHIASHNLRAPIANIHSLLQLYEMDNSAENLQFIIDQVKKTSNNLYETINELTEVIKTSWELNKQKQKLRFSEIFNKVKQDISIEIIQKNAVINENFDQIDTLEYPKVYLESILQNLLSNALKYCHPNRKPNIEVKTKIDNNNVLMSFKDNGLGIDLNRYGTRIFGLRKTFHQNENARGVGLFITKAQIDSMGGDITIRSEVNVGTEFIINFGAIKS